MMRTPRLRAVGAIALAATVVGISGSTAVAQEYVGSTVTVGGETASGQDGPAVVVAPGVTINGGNVSNTTGIGVASDGGASVGVTPGGETNAAIP